MHVCMYVCIYQQKRLATPETISPTRPQQNLYDHAYTRVHARTSPIRPYIYIESIYLYIYRHTHAYMRAHLPPIIRA